MKPSIKILMLVSPVVLALLLFVVQAEASRALAPGVLSADEMALLFGAGCHECGMGFLDGGARSTTSITGELLECQHGPENDQTDCGNPQSVPCCEDSSDPNACAAANACSCFNCAQGASSGQPKCEPFIVRMGEPFCGFRDNASSGKCRCETEPHSAYTVLLTATTPTRVKNGGQTCALTTEYGSAPQANAWCGGGGEACPLCGLGEGTGGVATAEADRVGCLTNSCEIDPNATTEYVYGTSTVVCVDVDD